MARNVEMCFKHILFFSAFCLAAGSATAEPLRDLPPTRLAQANVEPAGAVPSQTQNIQRLLKLLADRYPSKYRSVDPGRVDGSFGAETKDAIRNFQKISGSKSGAHNGEQLVADILATLAQMSATQAADPAPQSEPPANAPSAAPQAAEAPKVTASPEQAPEQPTEAAATKPAEAKPAAEAKSARADLAKDAPKSAKPKASPARPTQKGERVYFVQAASLKSLDSAKREWRRIFDENRAALTGEQVYFEKANVGDRGLFFRILIGPMNERDAAKTLCSFLQQNDQTCVVTSRDPADLQKNAAKPGDAAKPAQDPTATAAVGEPGGETAGETPAQAEPGAGKAVPSEEPSKPVQDKTPPAHADAAAGGAAAEALPRGSQPDIVTPQPPTPGGAAPAVASTPAAKNGGETAAEPKRPDAPAPGPDAGILPGAGTGATDATDSGAAIDPAPRSAEAPPAPATATAPQPGSSPADRPQSGQGKVAVDQEPKAAAGNSGPEARPSAAMNAARALVGRLSREPDRAIGIAAALIIATGAAVYGWRRRSRRLSLTQIFQSANLPSSRAPAEETGPLGTLENDFESDSLRQSRLARDEFLRDTLGTESDGESTVRADDSAMRINSSLKALLMKEPAQYKSIFLNWIFLAKVGAALDNKEISFDQLSEHINHEFDLLQTYFKIHLLELDDRHRIRQELPGLFYCLQLSQMKKRQSGSAKFSAA